METRRARHGLLLMSMFLLTLAAGIRGVQAGPGTVALGSDYLATQPGTFFDFTTLSGGAVGLVNFQGLPFFDNTDTIVQRKADATIGGAAIPIQIVKLSLESTAPVNIGGSFFDVFVTLDPAHLADDTGSMAISGTTAGGTFTSSLNVFFDAHFVQLGNPSNTMDFFAGILLGNPGGNWSPVPPPFAVLVPGPLGDQTANLHSGLPAGEVDFFPGVNVTSFITNPDGTFTVTGVQIKPFNEPKPDGGGNHRVQLATSPEPSSVVLWTMMMGAFCIAGLRKRMKENSAAA
jgi:hypothetical protein